MPPTHPTTTAHVRIAPGRVAPPRVARSLFATLAIAGALLSWTATVADPLHAQESGRRKANPQPPVVVETVDDSVEGLLVGVELGDEPQLRLDSKEVPLRDVLHLSFANVSSITREVSIRLADGSRLVGGIGRRSNEDQLDFNGPMVPRGVRIPLEWVRRVDYTPPGTPPSTPPTVSIPDGSDAIVTVDGGILTGTVEVITGRGVTIDDETLGSVERGWDKIRSVIVAPLDEPPSLPKNTVPVALEGASGSRLIGALTELTPAGATVNSALVGEVTVPIDRLGGVEFLLGRVISLSSREPKKVHEGNPYTSAATYERFFSWRRDRNVEGGPLTIGERTFRRGIGVHSESRLTFAIEPGDRIFQSWIGLDSSARPRNNDPDLGSVVFRVLVDGAERFHSRDVNWSARPRWIEVPLEGGKELELVVEMGKSLHILDRANWGDARILRE